MHNQKISVIVCTYNGERYIKNCLNSILSQKYKNFEVLCVDGMSSDKTKEIILEYTKKDGRIKLLINKKRLPEGKGYGKWLGYKNAKGNIISIIDQDNVLQKNNLFGLAVKIFAENKKIAGILGGMLHNKFDKGITRYLSLVGTDSFFAYRSVDFLRSVKNFKKIKLHSENIEKISLYPDNLPITGGNCFFYDKKSLELIGGYTQDILAIDLLVKKGFQEMFIIPDSTKHYAETSFFNLIKKKFRWGSSFKSDRNLEKFNYFPKTKKEFFSFIKNFIFCFLIVPNFFSSIRLYRKSKDKISFLFPFIAFLNATAYLFTYLFHK